MGGKKEKLISMGGKKEKLTFNTDSYILLLCCLQKSTQRPFVAAKTEQRE